MDKLPAHLKKYVVEQNYEKYTPIDQACWRYILRQLKAFLSTHAHECYLEGLEKTGIEIDRIPRIEEISQKLMAFGWRALPVSGFIPPAAFMELQSLGVLPIASDMRTLEHLSYTPAPDIVHEAAGHAPILVNRDFADYLKKYAEVAKNAIISKEDLDIYEAIRKLSDIKENPNSTPDEINQAQKNLEVQSKKLSHVSEATELGRMNWWTAEYGLIGDMHSPKIFGAGLLSSVGESKWCLSAKVKKIPLSLECIKQGYDITEPQPQLYVTPDFKTLTSVLDQMAAQMAFRTGGLSGLNKAIRAESVNTFELNSGLQVSGVISEALYDDSMNVTYIKTIGPTQIAVNKQELNGHNKAYHTHGFGSPVGFVHGAKKKCLSQMTDLELTEFGLRLNEPCELKFESGIIVSGRLIIKTKFENNVVMLSFTNCTVINGSANKDTPLFQPEWGTYDMAVGSSVTKVFGGPADRISYGEIEDFPAHKVQRIEWTAEQKKLHSLFSEIRWHRDNQKTDGLPQLAEILESSFPDEWLPRLEICEILTSSQSNPTLLSKVKNQLIHLAEKNPQNKTLIYDGLGLI